MTSPTLAERLARRIASTGPLTIADYMIAALADPDQGYYRTADPLGAAGDFTTAPEISQLFGELIGAWLIDAWDRMGRPSPVCLAELGPGRGTLMVDALRVGRLRPDWLEAVELHLVEINPALRQIQAERLAAHRPCWHDWPDTIPDGPMLLVANEFFDALPIRQLVLAGGAWRERLVGWNPETGFHFVVADQPSPLAAIIPEDMPQAAEAGVFEVSPAAIALTAAIAKRIATEGGAALVIDYGRAKTAPGASLQAVRRHRTASVLDNPGTADLTAHVDFGALARAATEAGATVFGPADQGHFLGCLGVGARAQRLQQNALPGQRAAIDHAVERLTGAQAMGTLFKAIAIAQPGLVPAGFSG